MIKRKKTVIAGAAALAVAGAAALLVSQLNQDNHWPPAEAAELRKIVDSGVKLAQAQARLADMIPTLGKTTTAPILESLGSGMDSTRTALSAAFSSESNSNLSRAQEVSNLFASVRGIARARDEARSLAALLPDTSSTRALIQTLDSIQAHTFDETLPYADPLPSSFPRIIGPHGDHESGQGALEHYVQYVYHCQFDGWQFWTRTDTSAGQDARAFFRKLAHAQAANFRAWGMTVEIVLPDDHNRILFDQAGGSGIRSYGFHREILALEYLYNGAPGRLTHAGRKTVDSAKSSVRQFGDAFARMENELALRNPAQLVAQWTGRRGATSNVGPTGWAAEFHYDFSDFWNSLDSYAYDTMGFFHVLPGPPCGEGTHSEGGVCVAN